MFLLDFIVNLLYVLFVRYGSSCTFLIARVLGRGNRDRNEHMIAALIVQFLPPFQEMMGIICLMY